MKIAAWFGLSLNVQKMKLIVTGREETEDIALICVVGGHVECVTEFPYLGSVISRMRPDFDQRIVRASRAFGALRKAVFNNKDLKLGTKRMIYNACVLSIVLYGSQCWTPLMRDLRRLESFHKRCIRLAIGTTNNQQWRECITSHSIRRRWGEEKYCGRQHQEEETGMAWPPH